MYPFHSPVANFGTDPGNRISFSRAQKVIAQECHVIGILGESQAAQFGVLRNIRDECKIQIAGEQVLDKLS
jgi:hypothetical protein